MPTAVAFAGLISHSTGMLAESAHSAADSANEIFLFVGSRRGRLPPDRTHPFGFAGERFLWAFMAAISSFLIGGCLSIAMAIAELRAHHPIAIGLWPWIVLAVAFAADGISWLQSIRQARKQAREYKLRLWPYLRLASDPVVRAIVFEDTAALAGIGIAATGSF